MICFEFLKDFDKHAKEIFDILAGNMQKLMPETIKDDKFYIMAQLYGK